MKNKILSAIALAIASITTQASTPIDDVEYYIGAGIGWHALKDKNPTRVGDNSINPDYLSAPLSTETPWQSAFSESGNGESFLVTYIPKTNPLEDKRHMSFSAFIGVRQFFDQGSFVGFEGQVSKTRKGFVVTTQLEAKYKDGTGKPHDPIVSQYSAQKSAKDKSGSYLTATPTKTDTVAAIGTTEIAKGRTGIDSTSINIKNSYTVAANIPVGIRFDIVNNVSVDVYGLLGYQYSKYKVSLRDVDTTKSIYQKSTNYTPEDFDYSGFTYGVGFDINVQQFKIIARYIINNPITKDIYLKDTNLLSKDTKDNMFSVNLSYVF